MPRAGRVSEVCSCTGSWVPAELAQAARVDLMNVPSFLWTGVTLGIQQFEAIC